MIKKKIYIAGKVTGENPEECTIKFKFHQDLIESMGFEAVNPLDVVNDWNSTWRDAMNLCIKALVDCDGIFFLPDHVASPGAQLEGTLSEGLKQPQFNCITSLKHHQWNS